MSIRTRGFFFTNLKLNEGVKGQNMNSWMPNVKRRIRSTEKKQTYNPTGGYQSLMRLKDRKWTIMKIVS